MNDYMHFFYPFAPQLDFISCKGGGTVAKWGLNFYSYIDLLDSVLLRFLFFLILIPLGGTGLTLFKFNHFN